MDFLKKYFNIWLLFDIPNDHIQIIIFLGPRSQTKRIEFLIKVYGAIYGL